MKIQNKKKMNKGLKIVLIIVAVILALAIIGAATLMILYYKGRDSLETPPIATPILPPDELKDKVTVEQDGETVYYNNEKYKYNNNIISILVSGIDKYSFDDTEGVGYNGQADANYLVVLNTKTDSVDVIPVNRDTMVDVDVYSHGGSFLRTEKMQLCLAYAYGDGKELSCENVAKSVSRILYNVPITYYCAIDFDAIPVLTEIVGGVDVPEYTADGTEKTGKTVTVAGNAAMVYLRYRNTKIVDSNRMRIERQKAFISAFVNKSVEMTKKDISTPINLYSAITDYMVTNVGLSQVTYLAGNYLEGIGNMNMCSVPGEVTKGEYVEFTPDATALYELVLKTFYEKQ